MKRILTTICGLLLLWSLAFPVLATETAAPEETRPDNACGDNLTWQYASGKLTISGTGEMDDFSDGAPWDAHAGSIYLLELTGGVTTIGAGAFSGFTNLAEVEFGTALREIGENAFAGCTGLTTISLPASFRLFGPSCFSGCSNLTEVHCAGGMPSFRSNCLWNGNHITVFCPDDSVWSLKYVEELEHNFGGRLEVLTESGKDVYVWPEETTPTEETTLPTTEAATEPTQAATIPETTEPAQTEPVPVTIQPTQAPTVPVPTVPEETEAEVQEPQAPSASGALIAVFLLSGTLSLLLIGMLIFKGSRGGGKYRR